ncbi:MAG: ABC transporter substrate-binding protein, partial [Anaerotignum sp.]
AEYTAADSNEVQSVVTKAVSECDVLYVPTDNTMANNTEIIKNIAVPAGIPVIAGEEGICAGCGIATLSISYYDLGVKAAEMAYDILVNGANPAEMPIQYVSDGITEKYNPEIVEALGIAVPEGMVAIGE